MENELAQTANALPRGSAPSADDNFNMNGWATGSSNMAQSSIPTLHATTKMQQVYSQWMELKRLLQFTAIGSGTTNAAVQPPRALDGLSWAATVPIAAHSLVPSLPNAPVGFPISELLGIPKAGLDHFVLATSSNGKPLYGAYVMNSEGEPRLQQLFEFSQTAFDAGVFLPVPTVGGHFQGDYGLDYARHRFCGSIASLPPFLRWPASPSSVCINLSPCVRRALLQVSLHPAAAVIAASSTYDEVHDSVDSYMSPLPTPSQGEKPDPIAVSSLLAPSYDECVSSFQEAPDDLLGVPSSSAPSSLAASCTSESLSPLMTTDEHPQQRVLEPVEAASSASKVTTLSAPTQREPDRCHPCKLCVACKEFWGIPGLPERHFEKEVFRTPEDDVPAILCSEKTAARKRKWTQCRHGPKSKTSEYRGVNLYKRTWKWEAHIWHQGEQLYLGASITKTHAAQVYDRAALFLFGPDAEINFKPEGYQKEYEFMQRLSYGQMVVYLRRESRQNGEEVRYPGVAKMKAKVFAASYRPRKDKESHEHIGYFKSEEEAVRAVLKEARRRRNYEMAAKILNVRHVRTVKPATGKIKQKRKARAACIVAALKVAGLGSKPSKRSSNHTQRAAAKPLSAIQTQAAALPTQEIATAPPKRQYAKKTAKSKPSAAAKDTATVPVSKDVPRSQETGATPPKRKYVRKSTKAQEKSAPKRSSQGPLPAGEVIDPAPVEVAVEAPPSQKAKAAGKRKNTTKSKSSPVAKKNARGSTLVTRLQQEVMAPESMAEEAPTASPAPLRKNRPRRCNTSTATRFPEITSTQVLANATQPMTVAPAAPTSPALIPGSSTHPFTANQPPMAYDFMSVSLSGAKTRSDCASSHAYTADMEGESSGTPDSQDSGYASSSCLSFQSAGPVSKLSELSYQTPPRAVVDEPRESEMRQFQEVCDWLAMQRRNLHGLMNPRLFGSDSSKSPGVIRPVARRLPLTNWTHQAGMSDAASGAQISANLFPMGREGGGQLYIDLFEPSAV